MATPTDPTNAEDLTLSPSKKKPIGMIIGFVACFLLSTGLSAGITYYLVSNAASQQSVTTLESEVESQLSAMRQSIEQQDTTLSTMRGDMETLKTYLRHSSADALKNIMVNQEENIQAYLSVMRQAIGDLGELVPKSSDWETTYQYQMDLALKSSMERASLLRLLKTGAPKEQSQSLPPQSPSN